MDITKTTRYKAVISEINFKSLVAEASKSLQHHANAHKLQIKTTIEGNLPFFSDKDQLQIIINNIVSNSIKFQHVHELNPCLNIHAEVTGETINLSFKDNGIGIPPESLQRVFDMFYRIPGSKGDGAGLGLFMVKEIVKKLKGKVKAVSNIGEGTTIVMELPNKIDVDLLRKFTKLIQNSK